jgi:predicted dehydrogenase
MINVALVGVSGFAEFHYNELLALRQKGLVRLAYATVINQDQELAKCRFLKEVGCKLFTDFHAMLREGHGRIDLCIIPTGIHLHAPMTVAALQAGCHVLVEKPAAATVDEIALMKEAERLSKKSVAVAYQHLYGPEIMKMKRDILEGKIGCLLTVKSQGLWPRPEAYYKRNNWAGRLKCGDSWVLDSPFNNALAHWLNLVCFFAGANEETSANPSHLQAELYRAKEIESADTACFRVETSEGVTLCFYVTHSSVETIEPTIEIRGSEGSLFWTREGIMHRSQEQQSLLYPVSSEDEYRTYMYESLIRRLSGEKAFVCGLDIAEKQTICANGAFLSSRINDIPPDFIVKGGGIVAIHGIRQICQTAFDREVLWSEMSVPWARPGVIVAGDRLKRFVQSPQDLLRSSLDLTEKESLEVVR